MKQLLLGILVSLLWLPASADTVNYIQLFSLKGKLVGTVFLHGDQLMKDRNGNILIFPVSYGTELTDIEPFCLSVRTRRHGMKTIGCTDNAHRADAMNTLVVDGVFFTNKPKGRQRYAMRLDRRNEHR